jgi:hypothetical protein
VYPQDPRQYPPPYGYHGYQPAPSQPAKRTEFGWASLIVSTMALLTCPVPLFHFITLAAATALVLAGWLGRHERSRIPVAIGSGIGLLALLGVLFFVANPLFPGLI